uniref:Uncharacterized protein n=1 Tax=Caenorhabditis tropicalis TaxID=1561998 RepID=A0A1I7TT80_9PELO
MYSYSEFSMNRAEVTSIKPEQRLAEFVAPTNRKIELHIFLSTTAHPEVILMTAEYCWAMSTQQIMVQPVIESWMLVRILGSLQFGKAYSQRKEKDLTGEVYPT